jgi:hypothetical protein
MLNNLYDLVWEAEFKNLVTPEIIASILRTEPTPFGISFKNKQSRIVSLGDLIQIGPTLYLVLPMGFRELQISGPDNRTNEATKHRLHKG